MVIIRHLWRTFSFGSFIVPTLFSVAAKTKRRKKIQTNANKISITFDLQNSSTLRSVAISLIILSLHISNSKFFLSISWRNIYWTYHKCDVYKWYIRSRCHTLLLFHLVDIFPSAQIVHHKSIYIHCCVWNDGQLTMPPAKWNRFTHKYYRQY